MTKVNKVSKTNRGTAPSLTPNGEPIYGGMGSVKEAAEMLISVGLHKQDYFVKMLSRIALQLDELGDPYITERQYDSIKRSVQRHYDEIERGRNFLNQFLK